MMDLLFTDYISHDYRYDPSSFLRTPLTSSGTMPLIGAKIG